MGDEFTLDHAKAIPLVLSIEQAVTRREHIVLFFKLMLAVKDGKVQRVVRYSHVRRREEYDSQRRPICKDKSTL